MWFVARVPVAGVPVLEHSPAKLVREGRREKQFEFARGLPGARLMLSRGAAAREERPEAEQLLRRHARIMFPAPRGAHVGDELLARDIEIRVVFQPRPQLTSRTSSAVNEPHTSSSDAPARSNSFTLSKAGRRRSLHQFLYFSAM